MQRALVNVNLVGLILRDDCSTRFEELKCANCMKKAIMARRIRYGIGLVVAISVWLCIFFVILPHRSGEHGGVAIFATFFALIAFSLSHGLSDYHSAMKSAFVQKSLNKCLEYYKKGMTSAKGEQLIGYLAGIIFTTLFAAYFALVAIAFGIVGFAIGSFFRRTILIIKEFKVDTSI